MIEKPDDVWPPPPTVSTPEPPKPRKPAIKFFWPLLPMMALFGIPIRLLVQGMRLPPGTNHSFLVSNATQIMLLLALGISIIGLMYWHGWRRKSK